MSFSWNPYRHVELIHVDPESDRWIWHCHSCGATSQHGNAHANRARLVVPISQAAELIQDFFRHIRVSHARNPADFVDWSIY